MFFVNIYIHKDSYQRTFCRGNINVRTIIYVDLQHRLKQFKSIHPATDYNYFATSKRTINRSKIFLEAKS